jgi:hypothetical protein
MAGTFLRCSYGIARPIESNLQNVEKMLLDRLQALSGGDSQDESRALSDALSTIRNLMRDEVHF